MKTKRLLLGVLLAITSLTQAVAQAVEDGEAFYIYRNDGDFNGFFYDEVQDMRYSKLDLDSIEHNEYVVHEVVTADSVYRIPLCAIDSIGFVQPKIILSDKILDYNDELNYSSIKLLNFDASNPYNFHYAEWETSIHDAPALEPGSIFYYPTWLYAEENSFGDVNHGAFIARIKSVTEDKAFYAERLGPNNKGHYVECEPVEEMDEIFKQLISVEKTYETASGKKMRRMAGYNQIKKELSGRRDVTLVDLNGSFYKSFEKDNFTASLSLNVNAQASATVTYNIRSSKFYIKTELNTKATASLSGSLSGTLKDTYTLYYLKDAPFYFPSFLPIFQINPMPGTFVRTQGDVTLNISTPSLGAQAKFSVIVSDDGISGSGVQFNTIDPSEEDNSWNISLSLNGSTQTGVTFPYKLETNSWLRKFLNCSVGADVFVGPKFSGSFSIDPAAAVSGDMYSTFKDTKVGFTPLDVLVEGKCTARIGKGEDREMELFKAEKEVGKMELQLFPNFDECEITAENDMRGNIYIKNEEKSEEEGGIYYNCQGYTGKELNVSIRPYATTLPCKIYAGIYNKDKELIRYEGSHTNINYHLYYQPAEIEIKDLQIHENGELHICPIVEFLGIKIPAWSAEKIYKYEAPVKVTMMSGIGSKHQLIVQGCQKGDIVEFEYTGKDYEKDIYSFSPRKIYYSYNGEEWDENKHPLFAKVYDIEQNTFGDQVLNSDYKMTLYREGRTIIREFSLTYDGEDIRIWGGHE